MDKKLKADAAKFGFEDLEVWQKAADFADKIISVVDKLNTDRRHNRLIEQLESSATSVPMNIAEGKGRCSKREFVPFLYIARYSLGDTTILSLRTHSPFGYTRGMLGSV